MFCDPRTENACGQTTFEEQHGSQDPSERQLEDVVLKRLGREPFLVEQEMGEAVPGLLDPPNPVRCHARDVGNRLPAPLDESLQPSTERRFSKGYQALPYGRLSFCIVGQRRNHSVTDVSCPLSAQRPLIVKESPMQALGGRCEVEDL